MAMTQQRIPRIFMEKRAEESEDMEDTPNMAIYFVIAGTVISLFAIFLVIATSVYQVETTAILGGLEKSVVEYRILNSPECFVYQDPVTKRAYPYTIDLEKFIGYEDEKIGSGMALKDSLKTAFLGKYAAEMVSNCTGPRSSVCFNAEMRFDGYTVAETRSSNYWSPEDITVKTWPVMIRSGGQQVPGELIIRTSKTCT